MNDEAVQKVITGEIWDEFCDALKEAGKIVQSEAAPDDAFNKAQGYRYMTRLLRAGLESVIEHNDADFPMLRCGCHETIKMGADNPDNHYQATKLNPNNDYRIFGHRGTVDYLGIGTVVNRYATGGTMETTHFIDAQDMEIGEDGSIEIILSQKEQPGNWLKMESDTNQVNVRQTFQDRINEQKADLKIERIGAENARPEPLSPERLARGLMGAVQSAKGISTLFENWSESFLPTINQLPPADQAYCQALGGDPNIFYFHSAWELADDEAMIIEAAEIPECQTWNFQLDNWWMESLDYRYHTIHINKHTAQYKPDGGVRLVIAHTDPGCDNWVETAGHNIGTMCWRWIRADKHPLVSCKIVKHSEIANL